MAQFPALCTTIYLCLHSRRRKPKGMLHKERERKHIMTCNSWTVTDAFWRKTVIHQCDLNTTDNNILWQNPSQQPHYLLAASQVDILDVITHDSHLFTGSILDTTQFPDLENHRSKSLPDRPSKKCSLPACGLQQREHDITHERSSALRALEESRMINKALWYAAHMDFITFPGVWDASGLLLMDQWG